MWTETGGAPGGGRLECDKCGRPFNTQRGLSLHQRKAHAIEYHLMHVPKVRKARWSHDERVLVAREEIRLLGEGSSNVNFELAATFTQRSLDAIKSVRRTAAYVAIRDRLTGRAPDQTPPTRTTNAQPSDSPAGLPTAHEQAGELAPATTPHIGGSGTPTELGIVSPPRKRVLRNPAGDGVGERYHSSASWSDDELQSLARAELRAVRLFPAGRNINQLLRGVVPCRSFDAMKGTRRTTKYKAIRTLLAMELDETTPDGPAAAAEGPVTPSSGDTDTDPMYSTRLDRPQQTINSGRRSMSDSSRLVRPRISHDSGRRSNVDSPRLDRPRLTSSTGRQCTDLSGKGSGLMDKALTICDDYESPLGDGGEVNTPCKDDLSLCYTVYDTPRDSRPRVYSSGGQSTHFSFSMTPGPRTGLCQTAPGGGARNHVPR